MEDITFICRIYIPGEEIFDRGYAVARFERTQIPYSSFLVILTIIMLTITIVTVVRVVSLRSLAILGDVSKALSEVRRLLFFSFHGFCGSRAIIFLFTKRGGERKTQIQSDIEVLTWILVYVNPNSHGGGPIRPALSVTIKLLLQ